MGPEVGEKINIGVPQSRFSRRATDILFRIQSTRIAEDIRAVLKDVEEATEVFNIFCFDVNVNINITEPVLFRSPQRFIDI